jgi:hypothetical protein
MPKSEIQFILGTIMKTVLIVIGVLALLCCGGGLTALFFGWRAASNVMGEAQVYGDASLNAVCRTWDGAELERRAAPELIEQNPAGTLQNVVNALKPLGALQSLESKVTGVEAKTETNVGSYTIATYYADCKFENGVADANLELLKRDDEWQILKFSVKQR